MITSIGIAVMALATAGYAQTTDPGNGLSQADHAATNIVALGAEKLKSHLAKEAPIEEKFAKPLCWKRKGETVLFQDAKNAAKVPSEVCINAILLRPHDYWTEHVAFVPEAISGTLKIDGVARNFFKTPKMRKQTYEIMPEPCGDAVEFSRAVQEGKAITVQHEEIDFLMEVYTSQGADLSHSAFTLSMRIDSTALAQEHLDADQVEVSGTASEDNIAPDPNYHPGAGEGLSDLNFKRTEKLVYFRD